MPVFGRRPWDLDAYVPEQVSWDYFLEISEWKRDFEKIDKKQNISGKLQEFLFRKGNPFIYYLFYKMAIVQVAHRGAKGLPYKELLKLTNNFWNSYKSNK